RYCPKNRPFTKPTCFSRSPEISSASASCFSRSGAAMRDSFAVILRAFGTAANGAARFIGFAANFPSNVKRGKPGKHGNELHSLSPGVYNPALELMKHQGGKSPAAIDGTERKHRPHPPRLALRPARHQCAEEKGG